MEKIVAGEFSESYPPLMDGVGQVVKNYERILRNDFGYDTRVVTTYSTQTGLPSDDDGNIIRFPMTPVKGLGAYGITVMKRDIKKRATGIDYDIIHTHSPFSIGSLGRRIAAKQHIPHVTTFHSQFRKDILGFTHSRILADIGTSYLVRHYEKADCVIVPSKGSIPVLRDYGYKGDITVIENGTDLKPPTDEERAAYRAKALSLLKRDSISVPVFLYIGQHSDKKNIPLTLGSLKILKERNIEFLMIFVGGGEDKEKYVKMVAEYNLQDNVIFYGITRNREDIAAFYSLADIFLFPSAYDTSSLTTRETSAFSLPCLFIESVTSEGFEDGINGFIAQPDPESYAENIIRIISDDELRKTVGKNALETRYRSFYDAAKEIDELYRKLISH